MSIYEYHTISHFKSQAKNKDPLRFYVYAYIRASNLTPYYIGKGSEGRAWIIHQSGISTPKDITKIVILESNLTELGAFALERRLIRWFGRKDLGTGILYNKTDGGEGSSGYNWSQFSAEVRSGWAQKALNTKKKNGNLQIGAQKAAETRKKNGYKTSEETRRKQSESAYKRISKPCQAGLLWWNNGDISTRSKECPGKGWVRGSLYSPDEDAKEKARQKSLENGSLPPSQKGIPWWNNGEINKKSIECPGDGFMLGMLSKGKLWNNGIIERHFTEHPGDGWTEGMLPTNKIWWNDGWNNVKSVNCPGEGWKKGLFKRKGKTNPYDNE